MPLSGVITVYFRIFGRSLSHLQWKQQQKEKLRPKKFSPIPGFFPKPLKKVKLYNAKLSPLILMKTYKNLAAIALSLAIASCSPEAQTQTPNEPNPTQSQNAIATPPTNTPPTDTNTAQNPATAPNPTDTTQRPETKTETISLEGEPYEITLNLFDNVAAPFTTYYDSEAILPNGGCSGEGCGFRFSGKTLNNLPNDAVYLHFFFPQNTSSLADLRKMYITGSNSLMANNPSWQEVETLQDAERYPWIKETTVFFDEAEGAGGRIMLGEHNNEGFVIIEYMVGEYGDGFVPRFNTILENLEFRT